MKRIIALILAVSMACSVFVGCRKSEVSAPSEEVIETESIIIPEAEPIIKDMYTPETFTTEPPDSTEPLVIETVKWEIPEENYVIDLTHEATTDHELIAWVIYMEMGEDGVCDDCRRRVADVILNLTECKITNTGNDYYWPDTIYGVISGGGINPYRNMGNSTRWPETASLARERHSVERAFRIAYEVLNGEHSEIYRQGYFYYAGANAYGHEPWTAIQCCESYFMRQRGWDNSKFEQDWFFVPIE